ncbi:hypothetical protein JW964_21120 [candidate division KSB1 bacterium]|nr:hypothetical protein [candidate division KSB1 bacterium]
MKAFDPKKKAFEIKMKAFDRKKKAFEVKMKALKPQMSAFTIFLIPIPCPGEHPAGGLLQNNFMEN